MFTQWDGLWYLEIVRSGYPRSIPPDITYFQLEARAAFFPLYPMLVRVARPGPPGRRHDRRPRSSTSCSPSAAVVLVGVLARRLFDTDVAERAMVLFAVFPGSFVLSYAYAEALLIVLAALCLWFLLDERWLLAGVAAALATATRPNGVALVAACAVAAVHRHLRAAGTGASLVAPLLAPIGFVALPALPRRPHRRVVAVVPRPARGVAGGHQLRGHGDQQHAELPHPPAGLAHRRPHGGLAWPPSLLGLWCLWRKRLPWPMVAYIAVVIALMLLPATVTARPRFLFTAFPLFISAAAWWPRRDRAIWDLMLVACGAGLVALTTLRRRSAAIP